MSVPEPILGRKLYRLILHDTIFITIAAVLCVGISLTVLELES